MPIKKDAMENTLHAMTSAAAAYLYPRDMEIKSSQRTALFAERLRGKINTVYENG
jgi:hypothetical protein